MKNIQGFKSFEAVGVPSGLVEISIQLYNKLIESLRKGTYNFEEHEADPGAYKYPTKHLFFEIHIPMKGYKINDYDIKYVDMLVNVDAVNFGEVGSPKGKEKMAGAGYSPKAKIDRKNFKTTFEDKGRVDMKVSFVLGDEGVDDAYDAEYWPNEILQALEENRTRIISSIGHEMMHAYDMGHVSKGEGHVNSALYQAYNNEKFGIKPIDEFLFYMYYTTRCESIVRSAEVASSMEAQGIEDSKFYDYLKSNDTYKMLQEVKEWTFDGMINDLTKQIKEIRKMISQYQDVSSITDEDLIEKLLGLAVHRINQGSIDFLLDRLRGPMLFGVSLIDPDDDATDEEKSEFLNAFVNVARKNVNDPEKYFRIQEKFFHQTADKLIKKLGKLFSLAKQSDSNPLHAKINAKVKRNESKIIRWNDFGK